MVLKSSNVILSSKAIIRKQSCDLEVENRKHSESNRTCKNIYKCNSFFKISYLEKQIKQIKAAAVFVGKKGIGPWQRQELDAFLRAFAERDCPVILVNAPKKPKLPIFLQGVTWVDFRKYDPNPMEQLIWGVTGKRSMLQNE